MSSATSGRIVGGVFGVLGIAFVAFASTMRMSFAGAPGPGMLPMIVGAGWTLAGLYLVLRPRTPAEDLPELPDLVGLSRVVLLLAVAVVHVALIGVVGYVASTFLLVFLALTVVSSYGLLVRLLAAVIGTVAVYLVFDVLLNLRLP